MAGINAELVTEFAKDKVWENNEEVFKNQAYMFAFNQTVMNVFNSYKNLNYLVYRTKPYNPKGRLQSEEEADALKQPMMELLKNRKISYSVVNGDLLGYTKIVRDVKEVLSKI